MKQRFYNFMAGRYGSDSLNRFLNIIILILLVLGIFLYPGLSLFAMALLIVVYFRMLSRNTEKRAAENAAYLQVENKVKAWFIRLKNRFAQRKTYRFYTCPQCRQELRVPKGKGNINITCPKCHTRFAKKS